MYIIGFKTDFRVGNRWKKPVILMILIISMASMILRGAADLTEQTNASSSVHVETLAYIWLACVGLTLISMPFVIDRSSLLDAAKRTESVTNPVLGDSKWVRVEKNGRVYWYNRDTKESQWEPPHESEMGIEMRASRLSSTSSVSSVSSYSSSRAI